MEEKYNKLSKDKAMSAREYFWVLRLAILRIDRKQLETSVEVAQYPKNAQIYECACRIAKAL